ncbi:MAG: lasso peptide biosynthesis B2 protein [Candidatus Tectimicrobiota bacterium]
MPWRHARIRRLHLPARRHWLLLEAAFCLLVARLALRLVPFRHLTWFFQRSGACPEVTGALRRQRIREVRGAILTVTRYLPVRLVCFPRAIAAQTMLRRRGITTTLYYGAARTPEQGLSTHVWVQDGNEGVIGSLAARGYHVLAWYPQRS